MYDKIHYKLKKKKKKKNPSIHMIESSLQWHFYEMCFLFYFFNMETKQNLE